MTQDQMKFEIAKGFEDYGINLPKRSTASSAGYDFEAAEDVTIPSIFEQYFIYSSERNLSLSSKKNHKGALVKTGVKVKLPESKFLSLNARSSNFNKLGLMLANSVGVIDSDYYENQENDGHIMFNFVNFGFEEITIKKGDRIGQGIIQDFYKTIDDSSDSERLGGFGSTN